MALLKYLMLTIAVFAICILPAIGAEIAQLKWLGMDADNIGEWDNGKPDGKMDGHFLLDLNLPGPTEIKSILIYSADASGNPAGGQFWDTAATNYWMLGVFYQDAQLNNNHVSSLGTFSGSAQFDLYCDDSGWFKTGNWFGLEVTLGDGTKLKRLISIGESSSSEQYAPLYRWYRSEIGDHFYTTDPSGELAPSSGYTSEGITGYLATSQLPGTTPLYRWYRSEIGDHFYTTDPSGELAPSSGYTSEGITGYLATSQLTGTTPLYRWYRSEIGDHFYTTDPSGELAPSSGYTSEGITGYIWTTEPTQGGAGDISEAIHLFSNVPSTDSSNFKSNVYPEVSVDTTQWDRTPYHMADPYYGTITIRPGQRCFLAGDAAGETGWSVDNFLLFEIQEGTKTKYLFCGDSNPVYYNGERLPQIGPNKLDFGQKEIDLTSYFPQGEPVELKVSALDYGGTGYVSDVYLIIQ